MTKDFDIEIETGLKHDITELQRKLAKTTKKTYVLVADELEKRKYEKIIKTRDIVIQIIKNFIPS